MESPKLSMESPFESQPQNAELRSNPENVNPCKYTEFFR